jgi:hypothetical protein
MSAQVGSDGQKFGQRLGQALSTLFAVASALLSSASGESTLAGIGGVEMLLLDY